EHGELLTRAAELLELDPDAARSCLEDAAERLGRSGHVVAEDGPSARLWSPSTLHAAEARLAARLVPGASAEVPALDGVDVVIRAFESESDVALAPEQKGAVALAAEAALLVVTGGPGVGKTTIVRAILKLFDRASLDVRLAAPTGRAAKRLHEAT